MGKDVSSPIHLGYLGLGPTRPINEIQASLGREYHQQRLVVSPSSLVLLAYLLGHQTPKIEAAAFVKASVYSLLHHTTSRRHATYLTLS